jgi:molecular chaperone HscB
VKEAIELLKKAFDETTPPDLELARNLVIQLKYLDNVETVCREWSPGKRVEIKH